MTTAVRTPLDDLDDDLRAACADRAQAWRALVIRDDKANRAAWDAACAQVDALLDMRHEMQSAAVVAAS